MTRALRIFAPPLALPLGAPFVMEFASQAFSGVFGILGKLWSIWYVTWRARFETGHRLKPSVSWQPLLRSLPRSRRSGQYILKCCAHAMVWDFTIPRSLFLTLLVLFFKCQHFSTNTTSNVFRHFLPVSPHHVILIPQICGLSVYIWYVYLCI